ncbi:MAG TPA: aminotransferase class I/II-fold pyridoxal phosphate-dependent enzyme, partial [Geminicoccaceae bacterium]|nr:aminotransferase class I/II-fold pyridoxal phosphate-dependent enzyme [Geminicoccaceae bacterium]
YTEVAGAAALRVAIAAHHERLSGQRVTPGQAVVLAGAQSALFAACQCLLGPGDTVLVPEPMYVTYPATIAAAGARLVRVPLVPERGFRLDLDRLASSVTPAVRAILVNSPNNPTGAVMTRPELEAVADLCRRHDLWLISDEVYASLLYEGEHMAPATLPGMAERTVTVSSLSKSLAMTGWRVGWLVGTPELARHVANLALCMLYGLSAFVQDAAIAALTGELVEVADVRERLRRRRDAVCRRLAGLPNLACGRPQGGMFVMVDVRRTGLGADAFARRLLAEELVLVLAGDAFGGAAAGHVRLSLTAPDERLAEACDRIGRFAFRLAAARRLGEAPPPAAAPVPIRA